MPGASDTYTDTQSISPICEMVVINYRRRRTTMKKIAGCANLLLTFGAGRPNLYACFRLSLRTKLLSARLNSSLLSARLNSLSQFVSQFWKCLHESLGTKLLYSTAYHPQTGGQTERVNQTLEDLLRSCALNFPDKWDDCFPLAEFSYNNSYVGYFKRKQKNPQAHGYRCNLHPGVFQSIDFPQRT